jgi:SAM-dependent methyltransferase
MRGLSRIVAADLTPSALQIVRKRLDAYGVEAELCEENAEQLTFAEGSFDHVNCQGVIHHTPNTEQAVVEIARVLRLGGTASISVYYRNPILRLWPYLRWVGFPLAKLGGGLRGRGRENIFLEGNVDEIVRLYDGVNNPIGKSYSRPQFIKCWKSTLRCRKRICIFSPLGRFLSKFQSGFIDGLTAVWGL